MSILVIAEHDNAELKASTLNTITAAVQIAAEDSSAICVLVAGSTTDVIAEQVSHISGVTNVVNVNASHYEDAIAEEITALVMTLAKEYSHILFSASTTGKDTAPRVAALLDAGQISDITAVLSSNTFQRPIYAGNAIATIRSHDPVKVLTVRSTAFDSASTGGSADIRTIDATPAIGRTTIDSRELNSSARPELAEANIVVSGGRGVGSAENFKIVESLADKLGAAIGASRAAVDAGYVPNDYQVGQTGKVVAPGLYIAVGISGAIQHLAGMKDSKVIVAINKDNDAPIFDVADFGLVGDLFDIVPELVEALN